MNARTAFDLIFRRAATRSSDTPVDIGVSDGRIVAIASRLESQAREIDVDGRLVLPGFVDSHIHLDKACLLGRCGHDHGSVNEAIRAVAAMKRDSAWAIDLSICVFPQEGLTNDPGTEQLLVAALRDGGDLIGGCPYMDTDPMAQLEKLFDLAQAFDVDVDLHVDFDLDPSWWHLDEVLRQTERRNYQGRVAIGHASKLSALPPREFDAAAARLARAGVAVTVLPATDLYLMGRDAKHNAPR